MKRRSVPLSVAALEDRTTPAVNANYMLDGTLFVIGDEFANGITITQNSANNSLNVNANTPLQSRGDVARPDANTAKFNLVRRIVVETKAGKDTVLINSNNEVVLKNGGIRINLGSGEDTVQITSPLDIDGNLRINHDTGTLTATIDPPAGQANQVRGILAVTTDSNDPSKATTTIIEDTSVGDNLAFGSGARNVPVTFTFAGNGTRPTVGGDVTIRTRGSNQKTPILKNVDIDGDVMFEARGATNAFMEVNGVTIGGDLEFDARVNATAANTRADVRVLDADVDGDLNLSIRAVSKGDNRTATAQFELTSVKVLGSLESDIRLRTFAKTGGGASAGIQPSRLEVGGDLTADTWLAVTGANSTRGHTFIGSTVSVGGDMELNVYGTTRSDNTLFTGVELDVTGTTGIFLGAANDAVTIQQSIFAGDFELRTRNGIDVVTIEPENSQPDPTLFRGRVRVNLGAGADKLRLGFKGKIGDLVVFEKSAVIAGGPGIDTRLTNDEHNYLAVGPEPTIDPEIR